MATGGADLMTILRKWENRTPMILTLAAIVQPIFLHIHFYQSGNSMFYHSLHATQTTHKDLNLVESKTVQIVPGFDAFARLNATPSQRALMQPFDSSLENPFYDHCIGKENATSEQCTDDGMIPYLVMNMIEGKSFYMTGRHNSNVLLAFLTWAMLGIVLGVLFFQSLGESLKEWHNEKTKLPDLMKKLQMWNLCSMLGCGLYVFIAILYSYSSCPNCPNSDHQWVNNASNFYGLVTIISIAISFYWSFSTQKSMLLFLKYEFPDKELFSTAGIASAERQPLIGATNQKQDIMIPASMSAVIVKSSSVKTAAIYDTSTKYDEALSYTTETFKKLPFTPTNTFVLKAMIPLLFLWALFSKTQKAYGLDVDLQLYVVALVSFAMNNYIFKKTLAFVSYTFTWCDRTFTGGTSPESSGATMKFAIFNSTYGQIVLSSVLIQFFIVIVLCVYEGSEWGRGPIFAVLWFIFVYDLVGLLFFLFYQRDSLYPGVDESMTGVSGTVDVTNWFENLLLRMFDTPFFAAYKYIQAPDTLYKPVGVVEFYGIFVLLHVYIWIFYHEMPVKIRV